MEEHNTKDGANGTLLDANAFWNFASHLYADPEIAGACLHLQDACGARVNLLLLGLWLAHHQVVASDPAALAQRAVDWHHQLVIPLRGLRRALKAAAQSDAEVAALRAQIQTAELAGERIEQRWLLVDLAVDPAADTRWLKSQLRQWSGAEADADVKAVHALVTAFSRIETKTK
ncbi:TIGR02444 family protein [Lacibacterium aquatile]|uniref:TIGR02444 family protein n=1 Tax=Lacibacterium aquatile TaxID=1168082 RepID=A0ABW5DS51_9PROT